MWNLIAGLVFLLIGIVFAKEDQNPLGLVLLGSFLTVIGLYQLVKSQSDKTKMSL